MNLNHNLLGHVSLYQRVSRRARILRDECLQSYADAIVEVRPVRREAKEGVNGRELRIPLANVCGPVLLPRFVMILDSEGDMNKRLLEFFHELGHVDYCYCEAANHWNYVKSELHARTFSCSELMKRQLVEPVKIQIGYSEQIVKAPGAHLRDHAEADCLFVKTPVWEKMKKFVEEA